MPMDNNPRQGPLWKQYHDNLSYHKMLIIMLRQHNYLEGCYVKDLTTVRRVLSNLYMKNVSYDKMRHRMCFATAKQIVSWTYHDNQIAANMHVCIVVIVLHRCVSTIIYLFENSVHDILPR